MPTQQAVGLVGNVANNIDTAKQLRSRLDDVYYPLRREVGLSTEEAQLAAASFKFLEMVRDKAKSDLICESATRVTEQGNVIKLTEPGDDSKNSKLHNVFADVRAFAESMLPDQQQRAERKSDFSVPTFFEGAVPSVAVDSDDFILDRFYSLSAFYEQYHQECRTSEVESDNILGDITGLSLGIVSDYARGVLAYADDAVREISEGVQNLRTVKCNMTEFPYMYAIEAEQLAQVIGARVRSGFVPSPELANCFLPGHADANPSLPVPAATKSALLRKTA